MTLSGAYGRDYKSKAEIVKDLLDDKDFAVRDFNSSGSYTNRADLLKMGITSVMVRYKADRNVTPINLLKLKASVTK